MKLFRGEVSPSGNVREADESMHQGKLSRVVELQSRDTFPAGCDRRCDQSLELSSVNECFKDVLLDIEVVLIDGTQPLAHFGEVLDSFADSKPADIVTGNFGTKDPAVSDVLLDGTILVIAANHRVSEMEVFNRSLEFSAVGFRYSATVNDGKLVGPTYSAISVQQSIVSGKAGASGRRVAAGVRCLHGT